MVLFMDNTAKPEAWVDAATVGAHLGFKPDHIRKLAKTGRLPGSQLQNGARVYWRFKISEIDAAMQADVKATIHKAMPLMSAMAQLAGVRAASEQAAV